MFFRALKLGLKSPNRETKPDQTARMVRFRFGFLYRTVRFWFLMIKIVINGLVMVLPKNRKNRTAYHPTHNKPQPPHCLRLFVSINLRLTTKSPRHRCGDHSRQITMVLVTPETPLQAPTTSFSTSQIHIYLSPLCNNPNT